MGQIALEKYLKRTGCIYGGITLHEEEKNRPKEFNRCECFQRWLSTKRFYDYY